VLGSQGSHDVGLGCTAECGGERKVERYDMTLIEMFCCQSVSAVTKRDGCHRQRASARTIHVPPPSVHYIISYFLEMENFLKSIPYLRITHSIVVFLCAVPKHT
jgi:hypothetical protein